VTFARSVPHHLTTEPSAVAVNRQFQREFGFATQEGRNGVGDLGPDCVEFCSRAGENLSC
jgi:hypothetical protein